MLKIKEYWSVKIVSVTQCLDTQYVPGTMLNAFSAFYHIGRPKHGRCYLLAWYLVRVYKYL